MPPLSSLAAAAATLAVGYLILVGAAAVLGALARGGRRDRALHPDDALAVSRFTIPVSVIVPVDDDAVDVSATIASLLDINYPEIEIIVVAEGSALAAADALRQEWRLEPKEFFYRRTLDTAPVRRIYGSARDPRVLVVEKTAAGRADALNCGISLARFRYVVSLSAGITFDGDALLHLMAPALIDPGGVLAVTAHVERRGSEAKGEFQALASIRSWMTARLAGPQRRFGLPASDNVVAWRRDAVLELGGFAIDAADPQLDLLARLQTSRAERAEGRVVQTSEMFGCAGTTRLAAAAHRAVTRRRALAEALATFSKDRASLGSRLAVLAVLSAELVSPLVQLFVLSVTVMAALVGWVAWTTPALAMVLLVFGNAAVSAAALLLRGGAPGAPAGAELRRLLLRAPLESALYGPALAWSRLRGV